MRFLFLALLLSMSIDCYADKCLQPIVLRDQKEIYVQGAPIIQSEKVNSVVMYQTSKTIKRDKANFYFSILNRSNEPMNFFFHNLSVTDQYGRPLRIVPKEELIKNKKSSANWSRFGSALVTCIDSANADKAGDIEYKEKTNTCVNGKTTTLGKNGLGYSSTHLHGETTTHGVIHNEALRQQAQRQVEIDSHIRSAAIQGEYEYWKEGLSNHYFDSNTIFPGTEYSANFQIDIPSRIAKEVDYLVFHYNVGGEWHSFQFYCGHQAR